MWQLKNIPPYKGGELLPQLYNCGNMLVDGYPDANSNSSFMHTVVNTCEKEFLEYCNVLCRENAELVFERTDTAGIYRQFLYDGRLYYCYYIFSEQTARIIEDNSSIPASSTDGEAGIAVNSDTVLMQFGLYYEKMIEGYTCDCGMLYVLRLRDNRVIIIDGGEKEQATKPAVAEFIRLIRKITGTAENEKITVAVWFCTHAHDDHFDFFGKLIKDYYDIFTVERLVYNFISDTVIRHPDYVGRIGERLKEYCPKAKLIKPHTGQLLNIGGVQFDVLTTHEDLFPLLPNGESSGMNESCTVCKLSFEDASFIILGDVSEENGDILLKRYFGDTLSATFLQAAHHGINRDENIYSAVKAETVLIPESKKMVNRSNLELIESKYGKNNVVLAGEGSVIYSINGKSISFEAYPVVGCEYDGSEI